MPVQLDRESIWSDASVENASIESSTSMVSSLDDIDIGNDNVTIEANAYTSLTDSDILVTASEDSMMSAVSSTTSEDSSSYMYESDFDTDDIIVANSIQNTTLYKVGYSLTIIIQCLFILAILICASLSISLALDDCSDFLAVWAPYAAAHHIISGLFRVHYILQEKYYKLQCSSGIVCCGWLLNAVASWLLIGFAVENGNKVQNSCPPLNSSIFEGIYIYMIVTSSLALIFYGLLVMVACFYAFCHTHTNNGAGDDNSEIPAGADAITIASNTIIKTFAEWMGAVDSTCAICMDEYDEESKITKMHCGHSYHTECINEWLTKSAVCPYCKQPITTGVNLAV